MFRGTRAGQLVLCSLIKLTSENFIGAVESVGNGEKRRKGWLCVAIERRKVWKISLREALTGPTRCNFCPNCPNESDEMFLDFSLSRSRLSRKTRRVLAPRSLDAGKARKQSSGLAVCGASSFWKYKSELKEWPRETVIVISIGEE